MIKTFALVLFVLSYNQSMAQPVDSTDILFDAGWQFFKGGVEGGQETSFDDSHWRTLDLPHDWSIEDIGATQSPFDSNAISQVSGVFTVGGQMPGGHKIYRQTRKYYPARISAGAARRNPEYYLKNRLNVSFL